MAWHGCTVCKNVFSKLFVLCIHKLQNSWSPVALTACQLPGWGAAPRAGRKGFQESRSHHHHYLHSSSVLACVRVGSSLARAADLSRRSRLSRGSRHQAVQHKDPILLMRGLLLLVRLLGCSIEKSEKSQCLRRGNYARREREGKRPTVSMKRDEGV